MRIKTHGQGRDERQRSMERQRQQAFLAGLADYILSMILALVLGGIGYALAFFDFGLDESWLLRAVVTGLFFFLGGFGFGYFNPRGWLIAGLMAWGCAYLGILSLAAEIDLRRDISAIPLNPPMAVGLILLFVPLSLTLCGGYLGKTVTRREND